MDARTRPPLKLPPALAPLLDQKRWLCWRWQPSKTGKPTKVPYDGRAPSRHAKSTDPKTWCDLKTAMATYCAGKADGIGFSLHGADCPIVAFDVDDCRHRETGSLHPWAIALLQRCKSYTEVTPSKTGIRIIGTTTKADELHRKLAVPDANGVSVELFRHASRYITVRATRSAT